MTTKTMPTRPPSGKPPRTCQPLVRPPPFLLILDEADMLNFPAGTTFFHDADRGRAFLPNGGALETLPCRSYGEALQRLGACRAALEPWGTHLDRAAALCTALGANRMPGSYAADEDRGLLAMFCSDPHPCSFVVRSIVRRLLEDHARDVRKLACSLAEAGALISDPLAAALVASPGGRLLTAAATCAARKLLIDALALSVLQARLVGNDLTLTGWLLPSPDDGAALDAAADAWASDPACRDVFAWWYAQTLPAGAEIDLAAHGRLRGYLLGNDVTHGLPDGVDGQILLELLRHAA